MNIYQRLRNKGIAMIEVLISSAVIGVGVVGTVLFMGDLTGTASYNKARDEAIALANAKIETVNNIMVESDYTNLSSDLVGNTIIGTNATFIRTWTVNTETVLTTGSSTALPRKKVTVKVSWDSGNEYVTLNTAVIWSDPTKAISIATDGVEMGGTYSLNANENVFEANYNFVARTGDDVTVLDDCTDCKIVKRAECDPEVDNCDDIPCEGEYTEFVVDGTVVSYVCADENNTSGNAVTISGEVCYDERNASDISDLAGIQSGFGKCVFPATTVTDLGSWIKAGYVCFSAEPYRGNIGILGLASNFSKTTCPDVAREYLRYGLSSDNKFYADGITQSYENQDFVIASMSGHDNCESKVAEAITAGCSYDEPFNLVVENGDSITITGWITNITNNAANGANIVATTTGGHATDGTNCRLLNDIDGFEDGYTCTVPASLDSDPVVPWSGTITATLIDIGNQGDVTNICSPTTLNFSNLSTHVDEDDIDQSTGNLISEVGCLNEDRVNGVCGTSNNSNLDSIPTTNLCSTGSASAVSGTGPWSWSCLGDNGGSTSVCSASIVTNGECGSSDGQSFGETPSTNLCNAGTTSTLTGEGPWNWNCEGENTGTDAACSASIISHGVCGDSNSQNLSSAPTANLCSTGTASDVAGDGPWLWSCSGEYSGDTAECSANIITNGSCGSSHSQAFSSIPDTNLCTSGIASTVTGDGPWNWMCEGENTGSTSECFANLITDGACGSSHAQNLSTEPSTGLCSTGTPSSVAGEGPWLWSCAGENGGNTAQCSANLTINATCGSSHGVGVLTAPSTNLCTSGTASTVSGSGPWSWDCTGENAGTNASCSAPKKIDGSCGPNHGQTFNSTLEITNQCNSGTYDFVSFNPATYIFVWSCDGHFGGSDAICQAEVFDDSADGVCGASDGQNFSSTPSSNLCTVGAASTVTGSGPWAWTCEGEGSGADDSCSANLTINGNCGSSDGQNYSSTPSTNLCTSGTTSSVSGSGPWAWSCTGTNGGSTDSCSANLTSNGSCGGSDGQSFASTPSTNLCSAGTASNVGGSGPWEWTCAGNNGGSTDSCSASLLTNGSCGSSNDQNFSTIPSVNLCSTGTSSSVSGTGPWAWTCSGANGGTTDSCSASLTTNGSCGSSDGQNFTSTPAGNLCSAGSASVVSGTGPWDWTCSGSNGGSTDSCSAGLLVNGTCGSSNGQTLESAPSSNLCSAGTESAVSGSGPWTWSCTGSNGGTADSCSAATISYVTIHTHIRIGSGNRSSADIETMTNGSCAKQGNGSNVKYYFTCTISNVLQGSSGKFDFTISSGSCAIDGTNDYTNATEGVYYGSVSSPLECD